MIIKFKRFTTYQTGEAAIVEGPRKDGTPIVRHPVTSRGKDEIARESPEIEARLIAEGVAEPARLSDKLAALAAAVLSAETPLAAALAGLAVQGVRPWHATQEGGYWCPVDAALGPGRGGFRARFRDKAEAEAIWATDPAAVPLFSFATPHGFDRAYIWRNGGLLEIPTENSSRRKVTP
ncbi:hypothetical protein [Paenirhodobacter sp.]|uniref:hypothetical protein n=1 Tax=Paenirhodobacter sp. TaxID=1965326 RepID=UPI003B3EADBB